jgi:hypothetical protein
MQLRRWSDLAVVQHAIEAKLPECCAGPIGLMEIAELCRRQAVSNPGRDWNETRDLILKIGIEWNLSNDSLEAQSDACLRSIVRLLNSGIA